MKGDSEQYYKYKLTTNLRVAWEAWQFLSPFQMSWSLSSLLVRIYSLYLLLYQGCGFVAGFKLKHGLIHIRKHTEWSLSVYWVFSKILVLTTHRQAATGPPDWTKPVWVMLLIQQALGNMMSTNIALFPFLGVTWRSSPVRILRKGKLEHYRKL